MIFQSPGEIALNIGSIEVRWYGILIAIAFIAGLFISTKIAKQKNEPPENILDLAFYLLISAIISARLYFVICDWSYYKSHMGEILHIWQGGLSIHGTLIGGFLTLLIFCKVKKLSLFKYADILSCGVIMGQAIGRWGNFFNSEAFGGPTDLPWKLYIPIIKRPLNYMAYEYFHPTFLYESLWNILCFFILYFGIIKRQTKTYGYALFSYLILYSTGRYFIEGVRIDSINSVFGIPVAQFISLVLIFIAIIGLISLCFISKIKSSKTT